MQLPLDCRTTNANFDSQGIRLVNREDEIWVLHGAQSDVGHREG